MFSWETFHRDHHSISLVGLSSLRTLNCFANYIHLDTPTQIGLVYTFSNDEQGRGFDETGCENCGQRREARVLSTGQIILTDHLIEHIKRHTVERNLRLDNLSREEVVDYLRTNLHWRVSDVSFLTTTVPSHMAHY